VSLIFAALLLLPIAAPAQSISPADVMARWYASTSQDGENCLVFYAGRETEKLAARAGIGRHVPTMLSMWHRESGFRQISGDDGRSFGITQTLLVYEPIWRKWWADRGVQLGPVSDPRTQIAYGVAEFWHCLRDQKGDEFQAVRQYNGSSFRAYAYARRVFATRRRVFGMKPPITKLKVSKAGKW
jgi:hypothetical protein